MTYRQPATVRDVQRVTHRQTVTGVDLQSVTVSNIERVTHRPVVTNRQAMAGVGLQTISDSDVQRVTHRQAVTGVDLQSVTGRGYTARVSWL